MFTEEEAKTKWCPYSRVLGTLRQPAEPGTPDYVVAQGAHNRGYQMGGALHNCMCIGSACMAWRFLPQLWEHTSLVGEGKWTEPNEINGYGRAGKKLPHLGYCGLAGRPTL